MGLLKRIAKQLDLSAADGVLYGRRGGYVITLSEAGRDLELFTDARIGSADSAAVTALKEYVQGISAKYKLKSFSLSPTGASIVCPAKEKDGLCELLDPYLAELRALGIPGDDVCSNCGQPLTDGRLVRISGHVHSCDRACAEKLLASPAAKKKLGARPQGSFLGFLGGLLGCALACAGYFWLGEKGYYCAFAAFFLPVFTYYGYYLLGGRSSIGRGVTVLVLPLLGFAATALALLGVLVFRQWWGANYVFSLSDLAKDLVGALAQPQLREQFLLRQVAAGGVFLLLGYVFALPGAFPKKRLNKISALEN